MSFEGIVFNATKKTMRRGTQQLEKMIISMEYNFLCVQNNNHKLVFHEVIYFYKRKVQNLISLNIFHP
jgi:hypothetical protein